MVGGGCVGHVFQAKRTNTYEGPGLSENPHYWEDKLNLNF